MFGLLGPELVANGGFECDPSLLKQFSDGRGDPGARRLDTKAVDSPPGWTVNQGPIAWLSDQTTRDNPNFLRPDEGHCFLDLTGNGAVIGSIYQRIRTRPGRTYEISIAVGMDDNAYQTGGPVEVRVGFIPYLDPSHGVIGAATFHRDRYDDGSATWRVMTQDVTLDVDPLEEANEAWADLIGRFFGGSGSTAPASDPHRTVLILAASDLTTARQLLGYKENAKSEYIGVDAVSVRQDPQTLAEVVEVLVDKVLRSLGRR